MKKSLFLIVVSILTITIAKAQWQIGGNIGSQVNQNTLPASSFLGSKIGNNSTINFGVNGNQDIFIDNLTVAPQLLPAQPTGGPLLGGHWVGLGRVFQPSTGLNANQPLAPKAHLHIHGGNSTPYSVFSASLRPWFQTGTLYSENSDAMYVGLRTLVPNSSYAVINWSDDNFGGSASDYLSFNFTGLAGGTPTSTDGMELGRFDPTAGTFGVGNFMNLGYYTEPVRRVEILDYDPLSTTHANSNTPQLRLTYQYNAAPANGVFSEFQSTNLGDLYINTHTDQKAAPYSDRFTGFHTITPKNTVEINSQLASAAANDPLVPASWAGSTGASGLRFSDLKSSSTVVPLTPVVYDPTKVLSVDQNGDVILINPQGTPPTNNGISILPVAQGGPAIQLGINCNSVFNNALLAQAQLTSNRFVFLNNQNLVFYDGAGNTGRIGIGNIGGFPCTVANTLEVGADAGSPYPITPVSGIGSSGLRFTHLTSLYTPIANGTNGVDNNKVLSVDKNGDVVLVTPAASPVITANNGISVNTGVVQLGVPCTLPGGAVNYPGITATQFTADRIIANRNHNFWVASLDAETGGIGFGGQPVLPFCNTGNTVEISANSKNTTYGSTNASGLRFAKLTSASPVLANGTNGVVNTKVLTVDGNGDVVLVTPASSGPIIMNADNGCSTNGPTPGYVHLGNTFGNTQSTLQDEREVPMSGHSIIFSEPAVFALPAGTNYPNTICLGAQYNPFTTGDSKLFVLNQNKRKIGSLSATIFDNNGPGIVTVLPGMQTAQGGIPYSGYAGPTGAAGYVKNLNTTIDYMTGVLGVADNTSPNATGGKYIAGVRGEASGNNNTQMVAGVVGLALGSSTSNVSQNMGGYFAASNSAGANYGIYAQASGSTGIRWAGFFNGLQSIIGGNTLFSDSSLKTNITPISNALATIKQLKPKSYYFDTTNTHNLYFPSKKQYGFLAQNVQSLLPELVTTAINPIDSLHPGSTFATLNYNGFIGLLTAGMQQQQLSIDSLRNKPSSGGIGNICGGTPNPLTTNYEVPLNGKNFLFSSNGTVGNVGIGDFTGSCNPANKLFIADDANAPRGITIKNSNAGASAAGSLYVENDMGSAGYLQFNSTTNPSFPNALVIGSDADINIFNGANGDIKLFNNGAKRLFLQNVDVTNLPANARTAIHENLVIEGGMGTQPYFQINYGNVPAAFLGSNGAGYGHLDLYPQNSTGATNSTAHISGAGISYINANSSFGINTPSPLFDLDVNGTIRCTGFINTSDSTLKTNIQPITNTALQKVKALRPVSFNWISPRNSSMYGTQYGFTAQQVATIMPDLVKTDSVGIKNINYIEIIPFLTKAIQEQQQIIDSLKASSKTKDSLQDARLTALENAVNACCNNSSARKSNVAMQDVELSDKDVIVLNQNVPNPFAEQTVISYNIPQNTGFAQLLFYDMNGRQIKTVDITTKGKGQVNVYANDLTNGMYSYTLIVDGKIIDTKKMVKQQ
jgi:hypothetical protein